MPATLMPTTPEPTFADDATSVRLNFASEVFNVTFGVHREMCLQRASTYGLALNADLQVRGRLSVSGRLTHAGSYGTSFPADPADGEIAKLVDSVSDPSISWNFRFNARSLHVHRWEFQGGSRQVVASNSCWAMPPSDWGNSSAPVVPILWTGYYLFTVEHTFKCQTGSAVEFSWTLQLLPSHGSGQENPLLFGETLLSPAFATSMPSSQTVVALAQEGDEAAIRYAGSASISVCNRRLVVTPVRLL